MCFCNTQPCAHNRRHTVNHPLTSCLCAYNTRPHCTTSSCAFSANYLQRCVCPVSRRIDYDEFARMMLTDERHGNRPEGHHTIRGSHPGNHSSKRDTDGDSAAVQLPGSMHGNGEGSPRHHLSPELHHRTPRSGNNTMHIVHGVKSGVWGLSA